MFEIFGALFGIAYLAGKSISEQGLSIRQPHPK